MKKLLLGSTTVVLATILFVVSTGCGKSDTDGAPTAAAPPPKQAATQLQQAFISASPEIKNTAATASQALQAANYEQAVQSLQKIKAQKDLTLEQGMAIYNSERSLEARLIAGINAGDPNAKRAYELLKKARRN